MADSIVSVNFDYTYNGVLSKDVLFKPTIGTPAISNFMTIRQLAKYKEQIPLLNGLDKQVKAYASCDREFTTGNDIVNTTLELTELDLNMSWCKDDFVGLLMTGNNLAEEMLKDGIEEFNPTGTQIQSIIDAQVNDVLRRDSFRILSFGDTTSPSEDFNALDGQWKRLIDGVLLGCVERTSTFGLGTLLEGAAIEAMKAAYEKSKTILKQLPKKMKYFQVTGSVYENLLSSYESNTTGSEKQFLNLVDGQGDSEATLFYRGIKVEPVYAWDESLQDTDNPLFGIAEHLLLYTTRDNHAAGFKSQSDSERASGWYERKDRKFYIESHYAMGYNYLHCDLQTVGY